MKIKRIVVLIKTIALNIFTALSNLFIWRNRKIWIIGGWFGSSFNDNSRFLFQYLYDNADKYGISKIVWVTRKKEIYDQLQELGYNDVVMCNSLKGVYYHLKSGVHIICNSIGDAAPGDINTYLSLGAKKIQLWHGVGIKACGYLLRNRKSGVINWVSKNILHRYFKPGLWGMCYQVVTSDENARVAVYDFGIMETRLIKCWYPRFCICPRLLPSEIDMIDIIRNQKDKKVVLFLPTFRNDMTSYVPPMQIPGFELFLEENSIIWIQKSHSVDKKMIMNTSIKNVIVLPPEFDVNVLYEYIDLLITDYSSATTDAIAKNKTTMEYCPDYDYYKNIDRGFVTDFEKYHIGNTVFSPDTLFEKILECLSMNVLKSEDHINTKTFLIGDKIWNYDEIVKEIKAVVKI